ncbi:MAG: UDP-3-O-(3-hydroxymyristoyl)glucosamine N-acyltransferase [Chloroflexi bacterium]|nr:UDP-3-O-(3-hydroxymyristoyl)glucosamine N-acyltransferase [Chloroflexota bacterium]
MPYTLDELAKMVTGNVVGDGTIVVQGVAALESAGTCDISFVAGPRYESAALASKAACFVVPERWSMQLGTRAQIRVQSVDRAMATIAKAMLPPLPSPSPTVHPRASIASTAVLGKEVHVGACAVIGERVTIGDGTRIRAGAIVADDVTIGCNCDIHSGVVLRECVHVGNRVSIDANSVIGGEGFGYYQGDGIPEKIPQLGTVVIGDDVEIGACVTVDRARFHSTVIHPHVKIDNLVQVAHNVVIGRSSVIVSQVAIAGSVHIGSGCIIWGQAAIAPNVKVGDFATVSAKAGVVEDVPPKTCVGGFPAIDAKRHMLATKRMQGLDKVLRKIRSRLDNLDGGRHAKK